MVMKYTMNISTMSIVCSISDSHLNFKLCTPLITGYNHRVYECVYFVYNNILLTRLTRNNTHEKKICLAFYYLHFAKHWHVHQQDYSLTSTGYICV